MNLIVKEFKQIISNRLFVTFWLVLLVVLTLFMTMDIKTPENEEETGAKVGIVNNDTSKYSGLFINFVTGSEEFSKDVVMKTGTKEEIEEMFYAGELDAYMEMPENFINNIIDIKATPLIVKVSDRDVVAAILVSNLLKAYQDYVSAIQLNITSLNEQLGNAGMSYNKAYMTCFSVAYVLVQEVFEKTKFVENVEVEENSNTTVIISLIYAAITIVIMYGSLFAGIDILKEKSYWVLNRYLLSPSGRLRLIVTKILFYSVALYMLVFAPTCVTAVVRHTSISWLTMILYFVFIVTSVSFSVLLCFVVGNLNTYALVGNMLYIVWILLGGGMVPVMHMPDNLVKIADYTPTRLFISSFIKVYSGKPAADVYPSLFICGVAIIVCIALSCVLFRHQKFIRQE